MWPFINTRCSAVILILCITLSQAVEWSPSPADGAVIGACVGQDVTLDWNYTLAQGETVEDIKWFSTDDRSNQMIAFFASGSFGAMPSFSGRVRHLGNARIELSHVTVPDSGNYSVEVNALHTAGSYSKIRRMALLEVAAPPSTANGALTLTQNRMAVTDEKGELHVRLTCGTVTDLGQPPVEVFWKIPDGSSLPSTSYDSGHFHLLLENPVTGGNYSCSLSPHSPAAACLHGDDPMLGEVTVDVDETQARLTLIEAQQNRLEAENADLKDKNANLTQHVDRLSQENTNQANQLSQYHLENVNLTNNVQNLEAELTHFHETASKRVSFHARLQSNQQVRGPDPVIMKTVFNNEGDAFSPTTGKFTTPFNGTYAFFASLGISSNTYAGHFMMVDSNVVCTAYNQFSGGTQGSSCHAVLHLVKGQVVWLKAYSTSYYWSDATVFSGFLLNADE